MRILKIYFPVPSQVHEHRKYLSLKGCTAYDAHVTKALWEERDDFWVSYKIKEHRFKVQYLGEGGTKVFFEIPTDETNDLFMTLKELVKADIKPDSKRKKVD